MIQIDGNNLVSDFEAMRLALRAAGQGDGLFQVHNDYAVKVKDGVYKVVSRPGFMTGLRGFVSGVYIDGFMSNAELYDAYVAAGGELTKGSFLKRLPRVMQELRPEVKRTHRGSMRGYGTH